MTRAIRKHLSDFIALTILIVIAIGVTAYILSQQESRGYIPLIEKSPFVLKVDFSDAQAVIPGQGQTVRVAGVEVGKIAKVEPKNGVAEVTMDLNRDLIDNHELDVRSDASAQLLSVIRPRPVKIRPSRAIWTGSGPALRSRNWGRKAKKNSAVFGLVTLTSTPWRKIRASRASWRTGPAAACSPASSARSPR